MKDSANNTDRPDRGSEKWVSGIAFVALVILVFVTSAG